MRLIASAETEADIKKLVEARFGWEPGECVLEKQVLLTHKNWYDIRRQREGHKEIAVMFYHVEVKKGCWRFVLIR